MITEKSKKHCSNCDTKYTVTWDLEDQDMDPLTCPFCGYEVEEIEQEVEQEEDNWN